MRAALKLYDAAQSPSSRAAAAELLAVEVREAVMSNRINDDNDEAEDADFQEKEEDVVVRPELGDDSTVGTIGTVEPPTKDTVKDATKRRRTSAKGYT